MTIAEIIQPGDKVDISFVQNVERAKKDQSMPKIYKSQVLDLKENGNLEISMPVERGKLVLLPLGIRMEFIFFSKGTLYRAVGRRCYPRPPAASCRCGSATKERMYTC